MIPLSMVMMFLDLLAIIPGVRLQMLKSGQDTSIPNTSHDSKRLQNISKKSSVTDRMLLIEFSILSVQLLIQCKARLFSSWVRSLENEALPAASLRRRESGFEVWRVLLHSILVNIRC